MALTTGFSEMLTRVMDVAVQNGIALVEMTEAAFGGPLGSDDMPRWERLENYLDDLRGQDDVWEALIYADALGGDPDAELDAVIQRVREATECERSLARMGGWDGTPADLPRAQQDGIAAVRKHQFEKRLRPAEVAVRAAQKIASAPPMTITSDDIGVDPMEQILSGTISPAGPA